jgi:hypothetical protein
MDLTMVNTRRFGLKNISSFHQPFENSNYVVAEIREKYRLGGKKYTFKVKGIVDLDGKELISFNDSVGKVDCIDANTFVLQRKIDNDGELYYDSYDYEVYQIENNQLSLLVTSSKEYRRVTNDILQIFDPFQGICLYSISQKQVISDYFTNISLFKEINGKMVAKALCSYKQHSPIRDEYHNDGNLYGQVEAHLVSYIGLDGNYVMPVYDTLNMKFINPNMEPIDLENEKLRINLELGNIANIEEQVYTKYLKKI